MKYRVSVTFFEEFTEEQIKRIQEMEFPYHTEEAMLEYWREYFNDFDDAMVEVERIE